MGNHDENAQTETIAALPDLPSGNRLELLGAYRAMREAEGWTLTDLEILRLTRRWSRGQIEWEEFRQWLNAVGVSLERWKRVMTVDVVGFCLACLALCLAFLEVNLWYVAWVLTR